MTPVAGIRTDAPLVVFDFDHTLYDGDSGGELVQWLLTRSAWRAAAAILASPLLLPLLAFLPTRRSGISGYLWLGTIGLHDYHDLNALIREFEQPARMNVHHLLAELYDGVDWVLVLMVGRRNIASGTTTIHGLDRGLLVTRFHCTSGHDSGAIART